MLPGARARLAVLENAVHVWICLLQSPPSQQCSTIWCEMSMMRDEGLQEGFRASKQREVRVKLCSTAHLYAGHRAAQWGNRLLCCSSIRASTGTAYSGQEAI